MERVVLSFCMIANINKVTKLFPETIDIEVCKDFNFFAQDQLIVDCRPISETFYNNLNTEFRYY